ncbi:hypothetical protein GCM10009734_98200 [Nonomuraea bangladeshensis]
MRAAEVVADNNAQRRAEIADAVLAIVADRCLAAVSLTEVAARAGGGAARDRRQHAPSLFRQSFRWGQKISIWGRWPRAGRAR